MTIKFLKSKERKYLQKELEEVYGITELPSILIETGKKKVRGFTGTMTREEIKELMEFTNVESIGLYLFKRERANRFSIDFPHLIKDMIAKGFVEIKDDQVESWLKGNDIDVKVKPGTYVVKNGTDFLGSAISNGEKLLNHVPKERRIRN